MTQGVLHSAQDDTRSASLRSRMTAPPRHSERSEESISLLQALLRRSERSEESLPISVDILYRKTSLQQGCSVSVATMREVFCGVISQGMAPYFFMSKAMAEFQLFFFKRQPNRNIANIIFSYLKKAEKDAIIELPHHLNIENNLQGGIIPFF